MRKIFTLLAAVVFFALCACGGVQGGAGQTQTPAQTVDRSYNENAPLLCVMEVTAGSEASEFRLFVNEENFVLALEPGSEAAASFCGEADVVGIPFDVALEQLLNLGKEQGVVDAVCHVNIHMEFVSECENTAAWEESAGHAVDRFFESNGMTGEIGYGVESTVSDGGGVPEPDFTVEEERDVDGNLVREVVEYPDGVRQERFYGVDGALISMIEHHPEGHRNEIAYHPNGDQAVVIHEAASGYRQVTTYNEDGIPVSEHGEHIDGTISETTFDERGIRVSSTEERPDGSRIERIYDDGGNLASEQRTESDGAVENTVFQEEGIPLTRTIQYANGMCREETYNENGTLRSERQANPDGYRMEADYDENGVPQSRVVIQRDGHRTETTFWPNGNKKQDINSDGKGRSEVWDYSEDGTYGKMVDRWGTHECTYHPNGRTATHILTVASSAGYDYTWEEFIYDESGALQRHTKIQNSGVVGVSTFHYDGSHTTVFTYPDGSGHTEYWYGNNKLGGLDSNGNPWGVSVPGADYTGLSLGGTTGK